MHTPGVSNNGLMAGRQSLLSTPRWWRERNRSWWWATIVVALPIVVLTAAAVLVLMRVVDLSTSSARLEMIKVALAVGAGTGAALTLVMARRRQWATEHDAAERRLTELYVKAVEQLGSEQAAVRHGGLYALERVAQDNPDHRQTVVNVICAYLRAPYTLPPNKVGAPRSGVRRPLVKSARRRTAMSALTRRADATQRISDESRGPQEREVRLTAQRILTHHLRPRDENRKRLHTYWRAMDLDLNSATLIDFDLDRCEVRTAIFSGARFTGDATFSAARFTGTASFDYAQFTGDAHFSDTRFTQDTWFDDTQFSGDAWFVDTQFTGPVAVFNGAQFAGEARFIDVRFDVGALRFIDAQFANEVPAFLSDELPGSNVLGFKRRAI